MKLLLINPAEKHVLRANLPSSIESLRGKNPPIGLLYVAAAARQVQGWDIRLLDAHALDLEYEDVAKTCASFQPDLVGITATTFTYISCLKTAEAAKQGYKPCKVIFGGVQPFVYPAETLLQPEVDFILSGEAELSFPIMLETWRDKGFHALEDSQIPGIYAKAHNVSDYFPAPVIQNLDTIPMPAWDMAPLERYTSLVNNQSPVNIMLTSRGCPYHCRYCALSPTGKKWRPHSPQRVVDEMKTSKRLGIRYLLLYDETFTVHRNRVLDICENIRQENFALPWMARATPDTVDNNLFAAMKKAGCDMITIGVESGSFEVLKRLGRQTDIEKAVSAFRAAKKAGLKTIAYFMIGNPGETLKDIKKSRKLAIRLQADMVHAAIYMPYPSTALYEESISSGAITEDYWKRFASSPQADFIPPFGSGIFSDEKLESLLFSFYRSFAFRPKYILKRLLEIHSLRDLRKAFDGLKALMYNRSKTKISSSGNQVPGE